MSDSDDEYVAHASDHDLDDVLDEDDDDDDDELDARRSASGPRRRRPAAAAAATTRSSRDARKKQKSRGGAEWEVSRTWETLVESADGTISATVEDLLGAGKRKRLLRDTTPLQRGIIRHLILVLDLSSAMAEKDLRPTRYLLTLRYAQEFVLEFFEQNPISQLGVLGMRDGLAVRISDMSGNPTDHIMAIQALRPKDPKGMPSLQNALEMARGTLFHTPTHGTREVLIIFGALLSSDPGDIHQTITALVADKIRISIIGLAAQVAICRDLCGRTNNGDDTVYGIALNEQHFRELFMNVTAPPPTTVAPTSTPTASSANGPKTTTTNTTTSSLLMMGFPSLTLTTTPTPSLCACHSKPSRAGYLCCRCNAKVCTLPSSCPCCGLTLILSTHLARSYHHLFPLMNWVEVSWRRAARKRSASCFACGVGFPRMPKLVSGEPEETAKAALGVGVSVSGRYECPVCECHFCIDCDVFAHEVVHNCPGCQSGVVQQQRLNGNGVADEMDTG
ncbi:transcription factor TFIIH [Histoplasma capsulatum var. duboisii H88]|uniref:General transcription and DNA repair factor IIH n=2 Tax=Ajellomyces capsulatus TaxID=5037 RepID=F0UQS8_AJEC8|nr:transcription factor TFIIH complex subunit Ssl1 [Histoplasma capsulatum H143]EGC48255.1 transcription factor TFIIH [Histoplasma capsulatum var. duboisii H88]QSS50281.1 transcription factor TFIIH complex subunit Ssl1 [Histoplasma capsulatum var. duboisii H88]